MRKKGRKEGRKEGRKKGRKEEGRETRAGKEKKGRKNQTADQPSYEWTKQTSTLR